MNYLPLPLPFFAFLVGIFLILLLLIQIGALRFAYMRLGVSSASAMLLMLGSLLGSYINIPLWQLPAEEMEYRHVISFYGMQYVIPEVVDHPGTVIAVNVGGAIIPLLLSLYLLFKMQMWARGILTVAIIAVVIHLMATPVRGVGIAVPMFLPPVVTAIVAVIIARTHAAVLAYVGGSLGTLIGADLLNLGAVQGLGAPVASIGGAGTFDGIFLTGILAVLLASFSRNR
jgi:uncharacterized membrane protein